MFVAVFVVFIVNVAFVVVVVVFAAVVVVIIVVVAAVDGMTLKLLGIFKGKNKQEKIYSR